MFDSESIGTTFQKELEEAHGWVVVVVVVVVEVEVEVVEVEVEVEVIRSRRSSSRTSTSITTGTSGPVNVPQAGVIFCSINEAIKAA